jgi:ATP-dependent DNA helicase RecG
MDEAARLAKLEELLKLPNELEWVEFKGAKDDYNFENVGYYFSALSNEAKLNEKPEGWLVLGVNRKHEVTGTNWQSGVGKLEELKQTISRHTTVNLTFRQIHEVTRPDGRVLMFEIPPAPHGCPIAWRGHYWGRNGESLAALTLAELDSLRNAPDWSATIVDDASVSDLDERAIATARLAFKGKYPNLASEVDNWSTETFLNKAKFTRDGKITHACLLLLGTDEASHWLTPAEPRMTWLLQGQDNRHDYEDYEHFGPPYLLNTSALYARIRNTKYRLMPSGSLFPYETAKYDDWVIRELLHNCIAHQDYGLRGRINVTERPDSIAFENLGEFIPVSVESVLSEQFAPSRVRNPFLVNAMFGINMIETIGSGIQKAFTTQRDRGFPLPDYDLTEPCKVRAVVFGTVIDENYTRALLSDPGLGLDDVIALDKVQKRKSLTKSEIASLKKKNLRGGRSPNFYVADRVLAVEDSHYKDLILTLVRELGLATPKQINDHLFARLPVSHNEKQKKDKIRNLIQDMSRNDMSIKNVGKRGKGAIWALSN